MSFTIMPTPNPKCSTCHGTGQVIKTATYETHGVSLGSTSISPCDCGTYSFLHSGTQTGQEHPDKPLFSNMGLCPEKNCEKCEGTGFNLKTQSFCNCWEARKPEIKCQICKDTGTVKGQNCSCWIFQALEENAQKAIDENHEDAKYGIQEMPQKSKPVDSMDKYWGNITTLAKEEGFFIKTMFMKAGTNSSLEYHLEKKEYYYIAEGTLEVGLRIGRGLNKKITLNKGEIFYIKPGLMHCRKAITDVLIIEWGNKDNDTDTYIVEDGKTYKHIVNEQKLPKI